MAPTRVVRFGRDEFITQRWDYRPGEHVTLLAPTQTGKTTLAFQLMDHSTTPELPGIALVMKPDKGPKGRSGDETVRRWMRQLRYRRVRSWPPLPSVWDPRPRGYVLWPRTTFDQDQDDVILWREMRKVLRDSYRRGDRIVFADETLGLTDELRLTRELRTLWMRGASMGTGLWAASQKPSHIPLWAYNQAGHLFLGHDPDERSRDRFGEIGGVDPKLVQRIVMGLGPFEWLYIRRRGRVMCIVDK